MINKDLLSCFFSMFVLYFKIRLNLVTMSRLACDILKWTVYLHVQSTTLSSYDSRHFTQVTHG